MKKTCLIVITLLLFLQMSTTYAHDESEEYDVNQLREISRAEFAYMITSSLSIPFPIKPASAIDIKDHWAISEISAVCGAKLMSVDATGHFYPDRMMTLEEAAVVMVRVMQLEPDLKTTELKNRKISKWAVPYVSVALKKGWIPDEDVYTGYLIAYDAATLIEIIDQDQAEKKARERLKLLK